MFREELKIERKDTMNYKKAFIKGRQGLTRVLRAY
jgi:hypothetical protein